VISISKNRLSKIIKVVTGIFIIYATLFFSMKVVSFIKYYYEKEKLTSEIVEKKEKYQSLKIEIDEMNQKMQDLKSKYISKEELENKLNGIFQRMALPDYRLKYIKSTQLCIDRYVIMVELNALTDKGTKAGEGILSYIGKINKSEENSNIYFVDYIVNAGDK